MFEYEFIDLLEKEEFRVVGYKTVYLAEYSRVK